MIQIQYIARATFFSILFLLFIFINLKAQNKGKACLTSGIYENKLIYNGEIQMFAREYDEAICAFEEAVAENQQSCLAMMYLAELYLVKGLDSKQNEEAIKNFDKAIVYTNKLSNIFAGDLNISFLESLALIYKANISPIASKTDLYKEALNVINIGLGEECSHPDLWFANGEWWFHLAEMPLKESKIILEAVNADLYMALPQTNRLLYDFALDAYANTLNEQRQSIFGLYGFIKMSVKLNYHDKVAIYHEQVVSFDDFYPLNHYYFLQTEKIVDNFKKQENKIQHIDF